MQVCFNRAFLALQNDLPQYAIISAVPMYKLSLTNYLQFYQSKSTCNLLSYLTAVNLEFKILNLWLMLFAVCACVPDHVSRQVKIAKITMNLGVLF